MHILFPLSLSPSGSTVVSGEQTTWKKLSSVPPHPPLRRPPHCLLLSPLFVFPPFLCPHTSLTFYYPLHSHSRRRHLQVERLFACISCMCSQSLLMHYRGTYMNQRSTSTLTTKLLHSAEETQRYGHLTNAFILSEQKYVIYF